MTLTALLVLVTGLAASQAGPAPSSAQRAEAAPAGKGRVPPSPPGGERRGQGVTCTLRIIHVTPEFDAKFLAHPPERTSDDIVRDSVSPCDRP